MAYTRFNGKEQRRSRSEEDLQSQQLPQQTSSCKSINNNGIYTHHDLGDFTVERQHQEPQQLEGKNNNNYNNNDTGINAKDEDDWLNENYSDLELNAEVHHPSKEKGNKPDKDPSDDNNTENDNSMSEFDYDNDFDPECDGDFDNDEIIDDKGFLEATNLHQVGYFDPDGMPYSYHGLYSKQHSNEQQSPLVPRETGTGNGNSCTESSDDDNIIINSYQYKDLQSQGGDQYQFHIDPTVDDDGCQQELDDPPFYTVMDAFHAYTMRKRVSEANQKWGTGTGTGSEESLHRENLEHGLQLQKKRRPIRVQFSERVHLYSVETPTDDEDDDSSDPNNNNEVTSSESPKKSNKKAPVVHVKEIRLEIESYKTCKQAQLPPTEVPVPGSLSTFFEAANNNFKEDLVNSGIPGHIPTPLVPQQSIPVPAAPVTVTASIPDPILVVKQTVPLQSPSRFSPTLNNAAESLSLNLDLHPLLQTPKGRSSAVDGDRYHRPVSVPVPQNKIKKLTKTCKAKLQPPPGDSNDSSIKNVAAKVKKKIKQTGAGTGTGAPATVTEGSNAMLHLRQKEREIEFQMSLADTIQTLRNKIDHQPTGSGIGIGDQSIRRIFTPNSPSIQSSAVASKSNSQEKFPSWKRQEGGSCPFTFATASETYKLGNLNKNASTFSSFPPPPPCGDRETATGAFFSMAQAGQGSSKLNPILQSILDPKNLELLTKACPQNSPILKDLKALIVKHNVPKSLLQNKLSKRLIGLLFENQNQSSVRSSSKIKTKETNQNHSQNQNNPQSKKVTSNNNSNNNEHFVDVEDPVGGGGSTSINVSHLSFQKETLPSKSKKSKTTTVTKFIDENEKIKHRLLASASAPVNSNLPCGSHGHHILNLSSSASVNTNFSSGSGTATATATATGSKWASKPELSLSMQQSALPYQGHFPRKCLLNRPLSPQLRSPSQHIRTSESNNTNCNFKPLITRKELENRLAAAMVEKVAATDNHKRKKSKLEMGFQALSLHNNCHAITTSTALANSIKPRRAPSLGIALTTSTTPRNKPEFSSQKIKTNFKNRTLDHAPGPGSGTGSSKTINTTLLSRKVKCV